MKDRVVEVAEAAGVLRRVRDQMTYYRLRGRSAEAVPAEVVSVWLCEVCLAVGLLDVREGESL